MTPLEAARKYALDRGWWIFPLRPAAKEPLTRHGLHDATVDAAQIERWWRGWPDANVGVSCGPSGLLVVDADGAEGRQAWADLCALSGGHDRTLAARTRRGYHVYFQAPHGAPWARSTSGRIGPHVDTRGAGGYVVAPPSTHPSGHRYRWVDEAAEVVEAPTWLPELLTPPPPAPADEARPLVPWASETGGTPYGLAAAAAIADEVRAAAEGTRNHQLNVAAFRLGRLVAGGELDLDLTAEVLLDAASAVGLGPSEARRTIWSGLTAGLKTPRQAPTR